MQSSEVHIHSGDIDGPRRTLGWVEAKVSAPSLFSQAPTYEEANAQLRQRAVELKANAVVNVEYSRGMSLTSYKVLKAKGIAIFIESDEKDCPACAEKIKRAAIKCRYCGSDVAA